MNNKRIIEFQKEKQWKKVLLETFNRPINQSILLSIPEKIWMKNIMLSVYFLYSFTKNDNETNEKKQKNHSKTIMVNTHTHTQTYNNKANKTS